MKIKFGDVDKFRNNPQKFERFKTKKKDKKKNKNKDGNIYRQQNDD